MKLRDAGNGEAWRRGPRVGLWTLVALCAWWTQALAGEEPAATAAQPGDAVLLEAPAPFGVQRDGVVVVLNLAGIRRAEGGVRSFFFMLSGNFEPDDRLGNQVAEWAPRISYFVNGGTIRETGTAQLLEHGLQSNGTWSYAYSNGFHVETEGEHLTVLVRAQASVHGDRARGTGVNISHLAVSLRPLDATWAQASSAEPIPEQVRPAPSDPRAGGGQGVMVRTTLLGWEVHLTAEQWALLKKGALTVGAIVNEPVVAACLAAAIKVGDIMNVIGGNNGVVIKGLWIPPGAAIVLPR